MGPLVGHHESSKAQAMVSQSKQLVPVISSQCQAQRNMSSLKAISMRLKSVRNTQIVSAMKMVSSAKFARAEKELKKARPMGEGALAFYEKAAVAAPEEGKKELFVLMTSDRGLCGGCHSGIFKHLRAELTERQAQGKDISNVHVICVGDKSRAPVVRM